jgi:EamA domain-containing membrane protein RarD
MKKVTGHIQHYLPLMGIFAVGFLGFALFPYDKVFQGVVTVAVAVSYVVWGIIHHHIHKDLHFSVFIEYISIAVLGLIVVFSLIFRA